MSSLINQVADEIKGIISIIILIFIIGIFGVALSKEGFPEILDITNNTILAILIVGTISGITLFVWLAIFIKKKLNI